MIARGFKPIGWVAAVGTAALGCYMLSLRVASERAELTSLQGRIVATRQQIRSLQTELGTRGRLQQLEQWNDDVLALAAPVSGQYLQSDVQLARFGSAPAAAVLDAPAEVRLASAATPAPAPSPVAPAPAPASAAPAPRHAVADAGSIAAPPPLERAMVQRTSLTMPAAAAPAPPRPRAAPARSQPAPARIRIAAAEPKPAATATVTARTPPPTRTRTAAAAERPRPAPARRSALLDDRALREIGSVARAERGAGGTRD
jgi:hypothetical protein